MSIVKGRGGKRTGAGRTKSEIPTKVIRVPGDFPDRDSLIEIVTVLRNWKHELDHDPKKLSSPRNEGILKLLDELPECLFIDSDK